MKLVLFPGMDGTGRMFEPFVRHAPAGLSASVVRYPPDRDCAIAELADIASEAMPPDEPAVIVAESFSGLVACELLKRHPTNVRGVVFVAAFLTPPRPLLLRVLSAMPLGASHGGRIGLSLIGRACLGRQCNKQTLALLDAALGQVEPRVLAGRLRMIRQPFAPPMSVDVPVCYLQATRDRLVPARCARAFSALSANVEVIPIDGPHMLLQSRPAECWQAINTSPAISPLLAALARKPT